MNDNIKNRLIMSDFDGTISLVDVNDTLFSIYGDKKVHQLEEDFKAGRIDDRQTLLEKYSRTRLTKDIFFDFIEQEVEIDPFFKSFYQRVKSEKAPFMIVSGGFINYIDILFEKAGIDMDHPIYANRLTFDGYNIKPVFLHERHELDTCHQPFGPCGNCKWKLYEKYRERYNEIVYIGDGMTDRCIAGEADILLSKKNSSLEDYCRENDIDFTAYNNFFDIERYIFG